jgi:hypothetical protein
MWRPSTGRPPTLPPGGEYTSFLDRLIRARVPDLREVLPYPDILDGLGVANHQPAAVTVRTLPADYFLQEPLAAFPLEPVRRDVAVRYSDEILVGRPGLQIRPDLGSALCVGATLRARKPSSV